MEVEVVFGIKATNTIFFKSMVINTRTKTSFMCSSVVTVFNFCPKIRPLTSSFPRFTVL